MVTYAKADRHVIILALVQAMQAWFLLVKFPQWQVAAMDFVRRRKFHGRVDVDRVAELLSFVWHPLDQQQRCCATEALCDLAGVGSGGGDSTRGDVSKIAVRQDIWRRELSAGGPISLCLRILDRARDGADVGREWKELTKGLPAADLSWVVGESQAAALCIEQWKGALSEGSPDGDLAALQKVLWDG